MTFAACSPTSHWSDLRRSMDVESSKGPRRIINFLCLAQPYTFTAIVHHSSDLRTDKSSRNHRNSGDLIPKLQTTTNTSTPGRFSISLAMRIPALIEPATTAARISTNPACTIAARICKAKKRDNEGLRACESLIAAEAHKNN